MTRVALVVLDTLRKDHFDEYFDWLPGTYFENAYATSHYTVPSHASLFTGLYPSETGTHAKSPAFDPPDPPLAQRLQAAGYETQAFSANVHVSRQFGWDRGFDRFDGSWKSKHANADAEIFAWNPFIREHKEEGPQRYLAALRHCVTDDCATLPSIRHGLEIKYRTHTVSDDGAREALRTIRRSSFDDDAFLFVNLMEAHGPYKPPADYRTVEVDGTPGFPESVRETDVDPDRARRARRAYADAVRYLSDTYREIFAELREDFDYVITLADHGESLGERGIWAHGLGLHPELTNVPLSIWGIEGADARDEVVSILDVHRTVLALADADRPYRGRGRDLRDVDGGTEVLTEYLGLNTFRERAVDSFDGVDPATYDQPLYGLAAPEDYYGYETFDDGFVDAGTAALEAPRERLRDLAGDLEYREVASDPDVPDSVVQNLKDLGYA